MLSISRLSKSFPETGPVINDLSFCVSKGKILGVVGPNGCGKTTLLAMMTNLLEKSSGSIQSRNAMTIGATVHSPAFYPFLTARQNLKYICDLKRIPNSREMISRVLNRVGLQDNEKLYKRFSYGMTQRLGIASALIGNPDLIILDEPTNGIDPIDIEEIKQLIKDSLTPGNAILLTSHQIDEVTELCDDILCLKGGRAVFFGGLDALRKHAADAGMQLKEYVIAILRKGDMI